MLTPEARERLSHLANEGLKPKDAAWKLLEFHERENGRKPLEAILNAENEAWEMGLAPGDDFWDQILRAFETIRDEDEAQATLFFSAGGPEGDPERPYAIGSYRDETEEQFELDWVQTDNWRGYAVIRPSPDSKWVEIHDDVILVGSDDERELKAFDDEIRVCMDQRDIRYVRAFTRSSNLFSNGYTLFVEQGREEEIAPLVEELRVRYRDPARFVATALGWKRIAGGC